MNLLSMLEAAKPWAAPQELPKEKRPKRKPNDLNMTRHDEALAKYKAACKGKWTRTTIIEKRLGMRRSCAAVTLRKWEARGIVQKRPVGGKPFLRKLGYEWKFEGGWK